jgi:hypothetical protein
VERARHTAGDQGDGGYDSGAAHRMEGKGVVTNTCLQVAQESWLGNDIWPDP